MGLILLRIVPQVYQTNMGSVKYSIAFRKVICFICIALDSQQEGLSKSDDWIKNCLMNHTGATNAIPLVKVAGNIPVDVDSHISFKLMLFV